MKIGGRICEMKRKTIIFGFIFLVVLVVLALVLIIGVREVYSEESVKNYSFPPPNSAEDDKGAQAFIISQLREILARLDELEKAQGSDKDTQKIILEIKKIYEGLSARQDVWGEALLKDKNSRIIFLEGEIARKDSLLAQISKKLEEALQRIKELEKQLAEKPVQKTGISQADYDRLKEENQSLINQLAELQDKLRQVKPPQEQEVKPLPTVFEKEGSPKKFSVEIGVIGQHRVFSNSLGFFWDNIIIHSESGLPIYLEGTARKFLIGDILSIQIFGGVGSSWFVGVAPVINVAALDVSFSVGFQYLPEYLVGRLEPVQWYIGMTHEGKWTQMSLKVVPGINLVQLSVGLKF
ncbi:MAG: hypothetical protein PHY72_04215 [Candidatus Pacebacteria bacterium]|nr:hypothetical protein [Candidatus Paceibacterota bacterium]